MTEPAKYTIQGNEIVCPHCRNLYFDESKASLHSKWAILLRGWLSRSATILACTHCGAIQWFAVAPDRVADFGP